jgi:CubicO group peptidase (beta-lactamase class C family)
VEHLLQARSGVYHEAAAETEAIAATRPPRGSHPPGTFHDDNNWDFNAAGTVFCQETARDIFATFAQEIASPIHRQDFEVANGVYECETGKSLHPADAIRMSARDLARFGVLYQREGTWLGRQVVPQEWIAASTTAYSVTDSLAGAGYGYMWNVIIPGGAMAAALGSPGYYHPGLGAHALIVLPELKLVIVERVDTDGPWTDPGEAGLQLVLMIINARGEAVP